MMKRCSKCKISKEYSELHRTKRTPDGVQCQCKVCVLSYHRQRNAKRTKKRGPKFAAGSSKKPNKDIVGNDFLTKPAQSPLDFKDPTEYVFYLFQTCNNIRDNKPLVFKGVQDWYESFFLRSAEIVSKDTIAALAYIWYKVHEDIFMAKEDKD